MAEFPALPLFTDAYLGDTTHLTTIEHGAYLLLLMAAWRSPDARLPDDDDRLARYVRMTKGQWLRISPTIREFFRAENGHLIQRRLIDEANHVRQVREKQRAAGRVSALKRKGRHSTDVEHTFNERATPTPSPTPTPPIDKDTSVSSSRPRKARTTGNRLPEGWRPQTLDRSTKAGTVAEQRGQEWLRSTFERFENYWRAATGKSATKLDWQAMWANWVITQDERDGRNGRQAKSTSGYGSTVDAAFLAIEDARHEGP